jgi:small subunit ribosomal protein S20
MPQHKSAAKRVRQTDRRTQANRIHRSRLRTMIKRLGAETDRAKAHDLLPLVKAYLDRLATKRILPKNRAAHYKSRLEKAVNALG